LKSDSRKIIGGLIIALGIIFLIDGFFNFDFWNFIWKLWPVALIVLGVYILRNQSRFRGDFKSGDISSDSRLFGDMDISLSGKEVIDHHYSTLIGDVKIDLTGAEFVPGEDNIPVKLSTQSLIGDIRFGDMKRDGFFQKLDHVDDNYESAEKKLFLSVSGVIGDLEVHKMKIDDVN
jgi:predicted membrane protein